MSQLTFPEVLIRFLQRVYSGDIRLPPAVDIDAGLDGLITAFQAGKIRSNSSDAYMKNRLVWRGRDEFRRSKKKAVDVELADIASPEAIDEDSVQVRELISSVARECLQMCGAEVVIQNRLDRTSLASLASQEESTVDIVRGRRDRIERKLALHSDDFIEAAERMIESRKDIPLAVLQSAITRLSNCRAPR